MSKYAGTKTEQNLMEAFSGESQARNKYTYYASAAKKAGYVQMANIFEETANQEKEHAKMWFKEFHGIGDVAENLEDAAAGVEAAHEERYRKLLESYKAGKTFKDDAPLGWKCNNCGFIYMGDEAPEVCPVCAHPRAYFERKVENY